LCHNKKGNKLSVLIVTDSYSSDKLTQNTTYFAVFRKPIQLSVASFLASTFFSKTKNVLPLVAIFGQEKIGCLQEKLSTTIWASHVKKN
jgi:hypothetical protein